MYIIHILYAFISLQFEDIRLVYHVSKSECYKCLWAVIDAINDVPELDISFPEDPAILREIELEFAMPHNRRYGSMSWRGQVGAIDGVDIPQRNPGKAVPNPTRYHVQRKGGHQILCIAICDAHRRFTHYSMDHEPNSHDSLAWAGSKLGAKIKGILPSPLFLNGDNAFVQDATMVVPMNDSDYDFYHSSNRMPIECAFGILVR